MEVLIKYYFQQILFSGLTWFWVLFILMIGAIWRLWKNRRTRIPF